MNPSGANRAVKIPSRPHPPASRSGSAAAFGEAHAWAGVGTGWCPLFGRFCDLGFSFEWHDFEAAAPLDWSRSFHPGGLELCLNLEGVGTVRGAEHAVEVGPGTWTLYCQGEPPLRAERRGGMRHRFLTVEFACAFLEHLVAGQHEHLHPLVRDSLAPQRRPSAVARVERLSGTVLSVVESLRRCPVFQPARETWFRGKAFELASHLLFAPAQGELLCTRTQRAGRERVARACTILGERMREAPSLEELGRLVGCSPYYLSRLFSQETGQTIQQHLRQLRLERAAELLRTGRCNVTEAALEVGYNSLSHFSTAFREHFRCCPGLYPLRTIPKPGALPA